MSLKKSLIYSATNEIIYILDNTLPSIPNTPTKLTIPKPIKKRGYSGFPKPWPSTKEATVDSPTQSRYIDKDTTLYSDLTDSTPGSPIIHLSITSIPE